MAAAWERLSQLVYAPLARHLTNVSHLIVCPDGQLSRLPFEMLRLGNKFLIEEKTISYVTSGREVARLAAGSKNEKVKRQNEKSLVMGNPDFDLDLGSVRGSPTTPLAGSRGKEPTKSNAQLSTLNPPPGDQSRLTSAATRSLSRSFTGIKFTPLTGSEEEAKRVAKLLGGDCVLRLGREARESELKAVVSPRVLHLATHGFFLSDQEFKRTNAPVWSSAFTRPGPPEGGTPNEWENPLVRLNS